MIEYKPLNIGDRFLYNVFLRSRYYENLYCPVMALDKSDAIKTMKMWLNKNDELFYDSIIDEDAVIANVYQMGEIDVT